jgi:2-phospho-L-lactate guanylyltransferase
VPADVGWRFGYGPGSFERHVAEARRLDLDVDVVTHEALAWDVDHPQDLHPPAHLGTPSWERADV